MNENSRLDYVENLKIILTIYLKRWPVVIMLLLASVIAAVLYSRYRNPVYQSFGLVMVSDDKKGAVSQELSVLEDLGVLKGESNVGNEIELLRSRSLLAKVASDLNLNVEVHALSKTTGLLRKELYLRSPFHVTFVSSDTTHMDHSYTLNIQDEANFKLESDAENVSASFRFGDTIQLPAAVLCIQKTHLFEPTLIGRDYSVELKNTPMLVDEMLKNLQVKALSKEATLISVSYLGPNTNKNNDIINTLFKQREIETIEDNNRIARKTSEFISARMEEISNQLASVESNETNFKINRDLTDLPANAMQFLNQQGTSDGKSFDASIQRKLYDFLLTYLDKNKGADELLPSNIGVNDPGVTVNIEQYNRLIIEKRQMEIGAGDKNPSILVMRSKLESLRNNLVATIKNNIAVLDLTLSQLDKQNAALDQKLNQLSNTERDFRIIQREQKILESLFLFLLQKKEENEISVAATISSNKVIDFAYGDGKPKGMSGVLIVLMAFILGLTLPFIGFVIYTIFDNRLRSTAEIPNGRINIIGNLPFEKKIPLDSVFSQGRSQLSEAVRSLRTNVSFVLGKQEKEGRIVLITSSISNEGKSFTAFNLAQSYAIAGKRVALVELDLRNPSLYHYFKNHAETGLSSFLAGVETELPVPSEPLHPLQGLLEFYRCGITPPNPAELLASPNTEKMFAKLKEIYDIIVIDTAPISLVTDTSIIAHMADVCLFMIRLNHTKKSAVDSLKAAEESLGLKSCHYIINGQPLAKGGNKYYYYQSK